MHRNDSSIQFQAADFDGLTPVDSYGPGFFRVAGQVQDGPILLTPGGLIPWSGFDDPTGPDQAATEIDILLLGTGAELALPPPAFRDTLEKLDIGFDMMATPAACRTYNVLLAEGRRVALAALPV